METKNKKSMVKCKRAKCKKLFNEKEKNDSYRNIGYGNDSILKIKGYCNSYCAVEGRHEAIERAKACELSRLGESKNHLVKSATEIYQSLTRVVKIQKVEVTSKLLGKIKELVEKAESKNK